MRLLQWFYAGQFETAERAAGEAQPLGIKEKSAPPRVLNVVASDTFSFIAASSATQLPVDLVQLPGSDSFSIGAENASFFLPINPPMGTGQIPVGIENISQVGVQPCAIEGIEVGFVEATDPILFVGAVIEIGATDSSAVSLVNEAGVIFPFIQVDDADASESFSVDVTEASTLVISVLTEFREASESLLIGIEEGRHTLVYDIPSSDSFGVGVSETTAIFAAEVFATSLGDDTQVQLTEDSTLGITTLSQGRDVSESLPLESSDLAVLPLAVSVESVDSFGVSLSEERDIFTYLVITDPVALNTASIVEVVSTLARSDTWALELSTVTGASVTITVEEFVAAIATETAAVRSSVSTEEAVPISTAGAARIDYTLGSVEEWKVLANDTGNVLATVVVADGVAVGVSVDPAELFPLLVGIDALPLGLSEIISDQTFIIAPEPTTVEGFPGLQAIWDDDPYMSLK